MEFLRHKLFCHSDTFLTCTQPLITSNNQELSGTTPLSLFISWLCISLCRGVPHCLRTRASHTRGNGESSLRACPGDVGRAQWCNLLTPISSFPEKGLLVPPPPKILACCNGHVDFFFFFEAFKAQRALSSWRG